MGLKERREREKQELRGSILLAASEIAAGEGWQAVTMRKVADHIEYSAPTLYEYFAGKEALLQELAREGFGRLSHMMRSAYNSTGDPTERMVRIALSYCKFAWDRKELYQVMHGLGGASCRFSSPPPEVLEMGEILTLAVREAIAASGGDASSIDAAMAIHWATLHGIVSLTMDGRLPGGREQSDKLVEQATREWLRAQHTGD